MKRLLLLFMMLAFLNGDVWGQAVYDANGHVLYGYNRFGRGQTVWSTDLQSLKVSRVSAGATTTAKGVPFKTALELVVRPSALKVVTRVAIQAGLMGASSYLIPWIADQALDWLWNENDNVVMGPPTGGVEVSNPLGIPVVDPAGDFSGYATTTFKLGYTTKHITVLSMEQNTCPAGSSAYEINGGSPPCTYLGICSGSACYYAVYPDSWYYLRNQGTVPFDGGGTREALPWGIVEDALESDFLANRQNGYELARDAMSSVGAGVEQQNANWPVSGPDAPGNGLTPSQGGEVQTALNAEITEEQKQKLANNEVIYEDDPNNPYGGWDDWEYSPEEIASAIEEKLAPYLEPGTATLEDEGEPPNKDSLPDVLDEFHDGVSSWEGLTLLNSLTLETNSANCNFCIDKPEILGLSGQVCWDCCPHESMLAGLGNILFGIMALCWLFWIFM